MKIVGHPCTQEIRNSKKRMMPRSTKPSKGLLAVTNLNQPDGLILLIENQLNKELAIPTSEEIRQIIRTKR